MDYCNINRSKVAFFAGDQISDKKQSVSRICLNTVLGESPFRDQIMKIQLMGGCELRGECVRFYGASFGIVGCRRPWNCLKA
jgi:hypothetical protein